MLESNIQAKLIKQYEAQGYYVIKLIQTNKNGIPDLLLIKGGIASFVEVKQVKGILSKLQEFRIKELEHYGSKTDIKRGV
jgi:Holliday junction resolvase